MFSAIDSDAMGVLVKPVVCEMTAVLKNNTNIVVVPVAGCFVSIDAKVVDAVPILDRIRARWLRFDHPWNSQFASCRYHAVDRVRLSSFARCHLVLADVHQWLERYEADRPVLVISEWHSLNLSHTLAYGDFSDLTPSMPINHQHPDHLVKART